LYDGHVINYVAYNFLKHVLVHILYIQCIYSSVLAIILRWVLCVLYSIQ